MFVRTKDSEGLGEDGVSMIFRFLAWNNSVINQEKNPIRRSRSEGGKKKKSLYLNVMN